MHMKYKWKKKKYSYETVDRCENEWGEYSYYEDDLFRRNKHGTYIIQNKAQAHVSSAQIFQIDNINLRRIVI